MRLRELRAASRTADLPLMASNAIRQHFFHTWEDFLLDEKQEVLYDIVSGPSTFSIPRAFNTPGLYIFNLGRGVVGDTAGPMLGPFPARKPWASVTNGCPPRRETWKRRGRSPSNPSRSTCWLAITFS